jgi:hypothetical protein
MDLKQTQVTDQNREQFYRQMYPQQMDSSQQLINLDCLPSPDVIAIDCCGWHYKNLFPEKHVLSVDPIKTATEFKLPRQHVYKLFDNRVDQTPVWPRVQSNNCAVIFDRSPMLKYRSVDQLMEILNQVQQAYQPKNLFVRLNLMFVDSARLQDRFYDLATMQVNHTVVKTFEYHAELDQLSMCFGKKFNDYPN